MMRRRREACEDRESFSPWESYSDLYCGLLLVFVLLFFFVIHQYITATENNYADTQALQESLKAEQAAVLAIYAADMEDQEAALEEKSAELILQEAALAIALADLEDREGEISGQEAELQEKNAALLAQETELQEKNAALLAQETELQEKNAALLSQEAALAIALADLADRELKIDGQTTLLLTQQALLEEKEAALKEKEAAIQRQNSQLEQQQRTIVGQQSLLDEQAQQLEAVVGVRSKLIRELNEQLRAHEIQLEADRNTGAIIFDSSLLFESGSSKLSESGMEFLRAFVPVYLDVLLREEFFDYVAEIIIEGHTDDMGTYLYNLELSQQRALTVAKACIGEDCDFLSEEQVEVLRSLISINGCSYRSPVLNEDGTVNPEKSRRVELKFRLKDQEMIRALESILNDQ